MATPIGSIIDSMGFGKFNWKIMFVIGMMWLIEGIEVTLISLVAPKLQCEWHTSTSDSAIMISAVFVGMGVGALYWGWLADIYGRRAMIIISSICLLYFALLTSVTANIFWFTLVRFFVGIGVGGIASAICYLVEFSTTPFRAKVVIGSEFFFATGNVFAAFISYLVMNSLGWRWFIILCATPIPFVILLLNWLPESIRYLQNTGNFDHIMKILFLISKENKVPAPKKIDIECERLKNRGSISLFCQKKYIRRLSVLVILWIGAMCSYYCVVFLNTKMIPIFTHAQTNKTTKICHTLTDHDYLQNLFVVLGEFPGLIISFLVIEKLGRKKSLMIGFSATSVCFFALLSPLTRYSFTIIMFILRALVGPLLQILYVFTPELFPTMIRNTALGVCVAVARFFLPTIPLLIGMLINTSFVTLIIIFSSLTLVCSLLCLTLPETTGKELLNS